MHIFPKLRWIGGLLLAFLTMSPTALSAQVLTVTLAAEATWRPTGQVTSLRPDIAITMLTDDTLKARITVSGAPNDVNRYRQIVLQGRRGTGRWQDLHDQTAPDRSLRLPRDPRLQDPRLQQQPRRVPDRLTRPGPQREEPALSEPIQISRTYETPDLQLNRRITSIRAILRDPDAPRGALASEAKRVAVREAPKVLTLIAMGGSCITGDANTNHQSLDEAGIWRTPAVCRQKNVQPTYLGALTPMASVNCNDLCNEGCMNFIEHQGERIMSTEGLATSMEAINNPGTSTCHRRTNEDGLRNRIVIGKWRNTEQEPFCGTPLTFNAILDGFAEADGDAVIMIGQSLGGHMLTRIARDDWRWGNDLDLELLALWDATSAGGAVTQVGSRPATVLNFYQYTDVPFQSGGEITDRTGEQYDLNTCFSHNAIARSQFVHHTTARAVRSAMTAIRHRARMGE